MIKSFEDELRNIRNLADVLDARVLPFLELSISENNVRGAMVELGNAMSVVEILTEKLTTLLDKCG